MHTSECIPPCSVSSQSQFSSYLGDSQGMGLSSLFPFLQCPPAAYSEILMYNYQWIPSSIYPYLMWLSYLQ